MDTMATTSAANWGLPVDVADLLHGMRDFTPPRSFRHYYNQVTIDDHADYIREQIMNLGWKLGDKPNSTNPQEKIIGKDLFKAAVETAYAINARGALRYLQDPDMPKDDSAISAAGNAMMTLAIAAGTQGFPVMDEITQAKLSTTYTLPEIAAPYVARQAPQTIWGVTSRIASRASRAAISVFDGVAGALRDRLIHPTRFSGPDF